MIFLSNEKFIIDKEKEEIISYEKFALKFLRSELNNFKINLSIGFSIIYHNFYNIKNPYYDLNEEPNSKEYNEKLLTEDIFNDKSRNFFKEYFKIIKNQKFPFEIEIKIFIQFLFDKNIINNEKLAIFNFLESKNYEIESGKGFGFDYLLYEKNDFHEHAPYLVYVNNKIINLKFFEILGKLRIANNYGKVLKINNIQIQIIRN